MKSKLESFPLYNNNNFPRVGLASERARVKVNHNGHSGHDENGEKKKTVVINDPLGQTQSLPLANIAFAWNLFCF